MGNWTPQYVARTEERAQAPVYCLVVFEDRTRLGLASGSSVIEGDVYDSMTLRESPGLRRFMLYDAAGFEIDTGVYNPANNQITVDEYGAFGTQTRTFQPDATNIGALWLCYATEQIDGELFQYDMEFPSGAQQEMDLIEGHTRMQPVSVGVHDTDGRITREMAGRSPIGKHAMILGGYRGLPFSQFTVLHAGPVTRMTIRQGSVYEFEIDTVMVHLKRKLFRDVADFSTTLSGAMTDVQTTIPLASTTGVYDSAPTAVGTAPGMPYDIDSAFTAAMYFKVGSEYMRHEGNTSPPDISRGSLGSTAAAHGSGQTVDMVFVIEGNPVSILLGLLLTRDPGYQPMFYVNAPYGHLDFWNTVDDDKSPLGLHLDVGDLDIDAIKAIRDKWVSLTYGRIAFSSQTDMETAIREQLLKPLGLNLFVTRAGKLSLSILRPALGADDHVLDENVVIGVPDIEFTNEEIINEVVVSYEADYVSGDEISTVTVIDATSQSTYDRAGDAELSAGWLRDGYFGGGLSKATLLATKKMRHHRAPNPILPVDVLFTETRADIGDIPRLTLANLPDPRGGRIGWNELSLIVGRRVDWQQGTLSLDLMHTNYLGKRYCMIAPSGTLDYPAASADARNVYGFASDGTPAMSDGSDAYVLI